MKAATQAVWWVRDYAYAALWQLRGVLSRARPGHYRSGSRTPVIVIPGIYESWHFMLPLIEALHAAGHPVHVIPALHRNRRPVAHGAAAVADYIDRQRLSSVVIVAHSKGGLIGKQVMMDEVPAAGTARAVELMIAISTPFMGSRYASYMVLPSLRAFRTSNAGILAQLAHQETNSRIVSLFGEFDPHIPEGSELPGAQNIRIPTGGHFRILAQPETIAAVLRAAGNDT